MEIQHTLYINLEERTDRRVHVEKQLASIGIPQDTVHRFNAVKMLFAKSIKVLASPVPRL